MSRMEPLPSPVSVKVLRREVERIELETIQDGSGHPSPDSKAGWIWRLAMRRIYNRTTGLNELAGFPWIHASVTLLRSFEGLGRLEQIMINRLDAGGLLDRHRDGPPDHYRYHLPIITNRAVVWWDEINGETRMKEGYWYGPVPYCGVMHSVHNTGQTPRIHLVADFS